MTPAYDNRVVLCRGSGGWERCILMNNNITLEQIVYEHRYETPLIVEADTVDVLLLLLNGQ